MILTRALSALRPGQEFTLNDDDISTIRWNSESVVTPTQAEIDAKTAELLAADQAKVDARQSALAKLAALGLTAEEIAAL
jgi:DNA-binding NarL/FixJ family response regulator